MGKDYLIDMHTHTCYSDGELTPDELIEHAVKQNFGILSITDHDTIMGLKNITNKHGIKLINGIELTAKVDKGRMHILGYDIDINNAFLNSKMDELKSNSLNSFLSVLEQIKRDYGIVFNFDEISGVINSNHNLGRPDIAKLCIKKGYASSVKDAFNKYLIDAYDKVRMYNKRQTYQECIELILKSGGIPVLAHPKSLELSEKELLVLIKDMINMGLKGIEVYHSSHSKEEIREYLKIAQHFDLLVSGGSDFHGKGVKPDIEVGMGKIKELSILDKIKA